MVIFIVLLCQLSTDPTIFLPDSPDSEYIYGYKDGIKDGNKIVPLRSFRDGFIGGLFFNVCGGGCISGMNYFSPEIPKYSIEGTLEYRAGYLKGYKMATMKKKGKYALIGGILGSACNVACVVFTIFYLKNIAK